MKFTLLLAALLPLSAFAQPDVPAGCIWQKTQGRCIVFNTTARPVACTVATKTTVSKYAKFGGWRRRVEETQASTAKVLIPAQQDADVRYVLNTNDEDQGEIERMQVSTQCK